MGFEVGDKVRLTGKDWEVGVSPQIGEVYTIEEVVSPTEAMFSDDDDTPWYVYSEDAVEELYRDWGAEIVEKAAPETEEEPKSDPFESFTLTFDAVEFDGEGFGGLFTADSGFYVRATPSAPEPETEEPHDRVTFAKGDEAVLTGSSWYNLGKGGKVVTIEGVADFATSLAYDIPEGTAYFIDEDSDGEPSPFFIHFEPHGYDAFDFTAQYSDETLETVIEEYEPGVRPTSRTLIQERNNESEEWKTYRVLWGDSQLEWARSEATMLSNLGKHSRVVVERRAAGFEALWDGAV